MPRINEAPFTAKQLRETLAYDKDTGVFTWRESRIGAEAGDIAGCRKPNGYIEIKIDGVSIGAHRAAWLYVHGDLPRKMIDHRNGVRDDNRIANLRLADDAQNQWNAGDPTRGIHLRKRTNKFVVRLKHRGQRLHIGEYETLEEAKGVRDKAAALLRGEFYPGAAVVPQL